MLRFFLGGALDLLPKRVVTLSEADLSLQAAPAVVLRSRARSGAEAISTVI